MCCLPYWRGAIRRGAMSVLFIILLGCRVVPAPSRSTMAFSHPYSCILPLTCFPPTPHFLTPVQIYRVTRNKGWNNHFQFFHWGWQAVFWGTGERSGAIQSPKRHAHLQPVSSTPCPTFRSCLVAICFSRASPLQFSMASSLCGLFLFLDAWMALYLLAICVRGSCQDDQMWSQCQKHFN